MGSKRLGVGALAGLAGGLAFGMIMWVEGMLPMVAQLIGSNSPAAGFLLHMVLSATIGAMFGLLLGNRARTAPRGAAWGGLYGVIWWIIGGLTIMPLWLGMPVQLSVEGMQAGLMSLVGHVVFGVIMGMTYYGLAHNRLEAPIMVRRASPLTR